LNRIFLLVGIGFALAVAGAVAVFRRRARSPAGRSTHSRLIALPGGAADDLLARLGHLALMQVGHSHRIAETLGDSRRQHLFRYVCETGFEHRRQSHSWLVAAIEMNHACSRATITAQDWLIAAAEAPACRELTLAESGLGPEAEVSLVAVVEDAEEWSARLRGGLSAWFTGQPVDRSWEIVPGFVVGYQAGQMSDEALTELVRGVEELAKLLTGQVRTTRGAG
jgi:hypothetical protein